ncbi:MAG: carboxypeptidase-like regulatory domain-containing protein, partial [Bacteroidota bacterium]
MKIKENITKLSLVKFTLLLLLSIAFCIPLHAQIVKGKVVDAKTKESLPFVHIGVYNQNVGVISDDLGNFRINLKNMSQSDSLVFSIIGYADKAIKISDLDNNFNEVTMDAFSYQIKPIVVTPEDNAPIKNYGLVKPSKTTIGQSGIKDFGFGGEWGILIKNEGDTYLMESIHFHTRFNTMDSVLFRMNVYEVSNGMPGRSLLDKEVFTKSYKQDKWIRAELG